jgi:hypothetical protein
MALLKVDSEWFDGKPSLIQCSPEDQETPALHISFAPALVCSLRKTDKGG